MYGKFFESAFTGSMVGSGAGVFAVWGYVIATAKPPGVVEINPRVLATMIGCATKEIERAIEYLTSPDPNSRSKTDDGRRLIQVGPFLYSVPNWQHYQTLRNNEERRAANAEYQRQYRARRRGGASDANVITSNDKSAVSAHVLRSTKDVDKEKPQVAALQLPGWLNQEVWKAYVKNRPARGRTPESLKAALAKLEKFREAGYDANEIVATSLANGWRGLFAPDSGRANQKGAPSGTRPSIVCLDCKQRAFTWTDGRCDPCWRKSQGIKNAAT